MKMYISISVSLLLSVMIVSVTLGQKFDQSFSNLMFKDDDIGKLVNCGNSTMSSFTAQWSPKDIRYGETVTINGDFVSAMDIASGKACYKIWVPLRPGPIVDNCSGVHCTDLQTVANMFGMKVNCPIKKGDKYSAKDKKIKVDPSFQLPQGRYKAHGTIATSNGTPFLCGEIQVNVL